MFKKILLSLLMLAMFFSFVVIAADNPRIRIDGEFVYISADDQQPIIVDGRTLVPLRAVMESLGFNVEWHQASSNARLIRADDVVSITIDQNVMFVNGRSVPLDVPARIMNNRTLVPVRAISEATGMTVEWDGVNLIVDIRAVREMTLPNRRLTDEERQEWIEIYNYNGGASEFELEVVRLVNEIRADNNLSLLTIDPVLMLAGRFYAQTMSEHGALSHNIGAYSVENATHGASANVVRAFGGQLSWGAGNGSSGQPTPERVVNSWMNSEGHRRYILAPEHRYIGVGRFETFAYMFLSNRNSSD